MGIVDRVTFIGFMNQKAAALHLRTTHFTNPSGLDDADHYSSAVDLAVMGATLLADYPDLRAIVASKQISIYSTPQHKAEFTLGSMQRAGDWIDYVAGVAQELLASGTKLVGADIAIVSDVLPGYRAEF